MPEDFRCSDAARKRQDPLLGTAPPQPRLLLVEQDSGWGAQALASLAVPDDLRAEIAARTEAAATRVMLIRRPGRHASSVCAMRSWCVVDPEAQPGQRVTWGTWAYPTELLAGVELAEELHAQAASGHRTSTQTTSTQTPDSATSGQAPAPANATDTSTPAAAPDDPLLLVCTNGKKDVCCAVRGRPVAAALVEQWPEQVWECTHTGGDRFAANVLVLPDGATYGSLDPDTVVEVIGEHRAGHPSATHLRGLIGHARPVQAALVGTLLQEGLAWGQVHPGRIRLVDSLSEQQVQDGAAELAAEQTVVARWLIDVHITGARTLVAEVTEHLRPLAALTCKAVLKPAHSRVPVFVGAQPRPS